MKKSILLLILFIFLSGCTPTEDNSAAYQEVIAQQEAKIDELRSEVQTLTKEKENLQALLDQFDPDILNQNAMVFTSISLLFASESNCTAEENATRCELLSSNATLDAPIQTWPSFMHVLNPSPDLVFIIYYDDEEIWIYDSYQITSQEEAQEIIEQEGAASIVKTFEDGRVLVQFVSIGITLNNPAAVEAYETQFKNQLTAPIQIHLNQAAQ
ncbi:MAG: hypothetical protein JXK92_02165 [Erysipelotrichaceae bacterium]|nr:hypothetical protein [Erysipelotrichaceae bacterium]